MNREDFPVLKKDIVYFDNGATTLKPKCVVDKMDDYYLNHTSNIHRGEYDFSIITNRLYDEVRGLVKHFINAESEKEIVYTSGTTESMNMIVFGFMMQHLKKGDVVLTDRAEHASSVLPWLVLQKRIGIEVRYVDLEDDYSLSVEKLKEQIDDKVKVISIAHISNVVGDIRDTYSIGKICKSKGIYFVVDAAQAASHIPIDVLKDNISFMGFSGHKMAGPTGVGILYGKYDLLEEMQPLKYGGGMNQEFESNGDFALKEVPIKFEAGTPPIAEVIGLGEAIRYIESIGVVNIHKHEVELKRYLVSKLKEIPNIILYNENSESGILAFNIDGVFAQDTAIFLNHYNIYVRAGNHCTKMLKEEMNIRNTCRISMYLYNNKKDVDRLVDALLKSEDIFKVVI